MKSGFISIIGRPNVGKSTLLNSILGEKISITTDKPQTTRNSVRGIYTDSDSQMIFIDTPGIHKPRTKLGSYMTDTALNTFREVDYILFLIDDSLEAGPGDKFIVELLEKTQTPKILIINKTDKMSEEKYVKIVNEYKELGLFEEIFGISAIEGRGVGDVLAYIKDRLEDGPMFFPPEMVTDTPERFVVSEIIREKLLMYLEQEIPHGIAVEIESFKENKTTKGEDKVDISAIIYCEKKSHKSIIIGKDGRKLKGVGKSARQETEALLGCKVFLELWVKIKENWRDSDIALFNFGYKKDED